eukprot:jgi/Tetstr1/461887/TSEL_006965.t1
MFRSEGALLHLEVRTDFKLPFPPEVDWYIWQKGMDKGGNTTVASAAPAPAPALSLSGEDTELPRSKRPKLVPARGREKSKSRPKEAGGGAASALTRAREVILEEIDHLRLLRSSTDERIRRLEKEYRALTSAI